MDKNGKNEKSEKRRFNMNPNSIPKSTEKCRYSLKPNGEATENQKKDVGLKCLNIKHRHMKTNKKTK